MTELQYLIDTTKDERDCQVSFSLRMFSKMTNFQNLFCTIGTVRFTVCLYSGNKRSLFIRYMKYILSRLEILTNCYNLNLFKVTILRSLKEIVKCVHGVVKFRSKHNEIKK